MKERAIRNTVSFYDKSASRWAATKTNSFWQEKEFRKFISYLKKGDRVLDIGCAWGIHVPLFLGIGRHLKYEGVDISKSMIKIARARYPQILFLRADISDKKILPRRKYSGFLASAVLMHVPKNRWEAMLQNIERLMKPRAIGYIVLPEKRPNPPSKTDKRHFEYFTKAKFRNIVAPRGWRILRSGTKSGTRTPDIWHWFVVRLP